MRFIPARSTRGPRAVGIGPAVAGSERRRLVATFNGGFKLSTGAGGFMSAGRTAVSLREGLGSIVTYADGRTDIGSWQREVPARGKQLASVRQNLTLLIWVGGEHATASELADALLEARVVRAVELDINPEWVAGYLHAHHGWGGTVQAVPVVPGQNGVPGFFLAPYSRDFFALHLRG